jgi:hypothetical protein
MVRRLATVSIAATGTVIVLAFLIVAHGAASDKEDEAAPQHQTGGFTHGEAERGLAAFLICNGQRLKSGDSPKLSFGVIATKTNDPPPPRRVKVLRPYPLAEPDNLSWISVTGPDGQVLRYQGPYVDFRDPQLDDFETLPQGAFCGQTFSELVPHYYNLRTPGKYRLRWHYAPGSFDGAWAGRLISNEVEIEIVR